MSYLSSKTISIWLGIFLLICCLPFYYLIFYIHPSGDDYSYAFLELKSPFLKAYLDEYRLWNGRFFSNLFVLKNPLTFGFNNVFFYRFSVFFIQGFLALSFWYFASFLLKSLHTSYIFLTFISLYLLQLAFLPALNEGFYWFTGVVTYQLSLILILYYIMWFYRFYTLKRLTIYLLIFIQLAIIGCNEIAMIYMVLFQLIIFLYKLIRSKFDSTLFIFTITSFIGFLIVFLAPGNEIRESYFTSTSHQFISSLIFTILQIFRFIVQWNYNGLILVLSLIFYLLITDIQFELTRFSNKSFVLGIPILVFCLMFLSIFPAYWTTGIMGQHRTVNFAQFFVIPLLFFWFLILIDTFKKRISLLLNFNVVFFISLFFLILVTSTNLKNVFSDILNGNHIVFDNQNKIRYSEIEKQLKNKNSDVKLKKLSVHPNSIFIYDLSIDPNDLSNLGYKRYWKIRGEVLLNP